MHCKMCNKEFCWVCLGDWKDHNSNTGGYYKCNKFKEDDVKSKKINNAKFELQKYMFYFERYNNHSKSQKHAEQLVPVISNKVKLLHTLKQYPFIELDFLTTAI